MDNSIEIKELNKFYGRKKQALSNVNLTIEQGMFGLLGRNGAGKSSPLYFRNKVEAFVYAVFR